MCPRREPGREPVDRRPPPRHCRPACDRHGRGGSGNSPAAAGSPPAGGGWRLPLPGGRGRAGRWRAATTQRETGRRPCRAVRAPSSASVARLALCRCSASAMRAEASAGAQSVALRSKVSASSYSSSADNCRPSMTRATTSVSSRAISASRIIPASLLVPGGDRPGRLAERRAAGRGLDRFLFRLFGVLGLAELAQGGAQQAQEGGVAGMGFEELPRLAASRGGVGGEQLPRLAQRRIGVGNNRRFHAHSGQSGHAHAARGSMAG